MRFDPRVEKWRITECGPWSSHVGATHGAFLIPGPLNNHDTCLHLWRPLDVAIPLPPSIAVGVRDEA